MKTLLIRPVRANATTRLIAPDVTATKVRAAARAAEAKSTVVEMIKYLIIDNSSRYLDS
jgi:hypothetical protein